MGTPLEKHLPSSKLWKVNPLVFPKNSLYFAIEKILSNIFSLFPKGWDSCIYLLTHRHLLAFDSTCYLSSE